MEEGAGLGYLVFVDDAAAISALTLADAQSKAMRYVAGRPALRIEFATTPARMRVWTYDYQLGQWVERASGDKPCPSGTSSVWHLERGAG